MLLRATDKAKWNNEEWDKAFNLINDFKSEFSLKVESINHLSTNKYCFTVGDFEIYIKKTSQGFWITLESNVQKSEFDEKFIFIFSRLS